MDAFADGRLRIRRRQERHRTHVLAPQARDERDPGRLQTTVVEGFASNIPITIFSRNDMCDLSPHNRPLEHFKDSSLHTQGPGLVNSDFYQNEGVSL